MFDMLPIAKWAELVQELLDSLSARHARHAVSSNAIRSHKRLLSDIYNIH